PFRQGERPVGRGNCPEKSWASRPRGSNPSLSSTPPESVGEDAGVSYQRTGFDSPWRCRCEVAQLAERARPLPGRLGVRGPPSQPETRGPDGKAHGCRSRLTRFDSETRLQAGQVLTDAQLATNQQEWGSTHVPFHRGSVAETAQAPGRNPG